MFGPANRYGQGGELRERRPKGLPQDFEEIGKKRFGAFSTTETYSARGTEAHPPGRVVRCAPGLAATVEVEVHGDRGVDLGRFTVQQVGFVLPLLHCIDGRAREHGRTADHAQILNRTRLGDLGT